MERPDHQRLIEDLRAALQVAPDRRRPARPAFRVPADRYTSPANHERERNGLFGGMRGGRWNGMSRVIAASSSITPGMCVPLDVAGTSLILTRGEDGTVRAMANACRHRATRLVDAPCKAKAMVCPYHGWTYDLRGSLMHVPHAESFIAEDRRDLVSVPVTECHGMIWLGSDVKRYLGGLDGDFTAMGLARSALWQSRRATLRCNWKLVIEAFLDGYHFRMLHRDTIYKFFLDATALAEPVGPHVRAVTARRGILEAPRDVSEVANLRDLATPSYILFPGTIVVAHPDFVSVVVLHPLAADQTDYEHFMLVPSDRLDETGHWNKSWKLIEEVLFQKEDLWACEQVQRGLAAGTTDAMLFGELETAVRLFHAAVDERLAYPVNEERLVHPSSLRAVRPMSASGGG
jgi:phenylpropionate dioxygenase-like ring-hydroxylating dioxygenase large terminal subunit